MPPSEKFHPYEKLLSGIREELARLRAEINALPKAGLLDLPVLVLKKLLASEAPAQNVEDIRDRLDKLESKAKSALDTYSRGQWEEGSKPYLAEIIGLIREIGALKNRLDGRDIARADRDDDTPGREGDAGGGAEPDDKREPKRRKYTFGS